MPTHNGGGSMLRELRDKLKTAMIESIQREDWNAHNQYRQRLDELVSLQAQVDTIYAEIARTPGRRGRGPAKLVAVAPAAKRLGRKPAAKAKAAAPAYDPSFVHPDGYYAVKIGRKNVRYEVRGGKLIRALNATSGAMLEPTWKRLAKYFTTRAENVGAFLHSYGPKTVGENALAGKPAKSANGRRKRLAASPATVKSAAPAKRSPGRPRKVAAAPTPMPLKRKPGRPRKEAAVAAAPAKRGPGRPKKGAVAAKPVKSAKSARGGARGPATKAAAAPMPASPRTPMAAAPPMPASPRAPMAAAPPMPASPRAPMAAAPTAAPASLRPMAGGSTPAPGSRLIGVHAGREYEAIVLSPNQVQVGPELYSSLQVATREITHDPSLAASSFWMEEHER